MSNFLPMFELSVGKPDEIVELDKKKGKKKNKNKKKNKKPEQPDPTPKPDFILEQGHCALIDTGLIPVGETSMINIQGCTTIEFFESFTSKEAQEVWNSYKPSDPWSAPLQPTNPNQSSMMVIRDPLQRIEVISAFAKDSLFKLENSQYQEKYSNYVLTRIDPRYVNPQRCMQVYGPTLTAIIDGDIFAGVANECTELKTAKLTP